MSGVQHHLLLQLQAPIPPPTASSASLRCLMNTEPIRIIQGKADAKKSKLYGKVGKKIVQ